MIECPAHEGNFDCTPFCAICEGEQEYDSTVELGWLAKKQMEELHEYID